MDPGETTGVCLISGNAIEWEDQLRTKIVSDSHFELARVILKYKPDIVAIEDYKIYDWKSDEHKWSALHTPKVIGVFISLCIQNEKPYTLRMAQPVKHFVTDEKLKAWGMYTKGKRHARDATRHALYELIFGKK